MYANQQPAFAPLPVSPEKAFSSYVLGRWVLFILLGSLPALFLSSIPGGVSILGLILLALPAYLTYRGQNEVNQKAHHLGDTTKTPLWLTLGATGLSTILNFAFSGMAGGDYSNASIFSLATIVGASIYGIRTLEIPAGINPDAVDRKTRLAASTAAIFTGSLVLLVIMSILTTMISVTVGLALLFFLGGETGLILFILCGMPLLSGLGTLTVGIMVRRKRLEERLANPALPNPIFHTKETVLFSFSVSSFFLSAGLFFVLFFAAYQAGTLINQF